MPLTRFGVSLPSELSRRFDDLIRSRNYPNRSEAIRDLIRRELVQEEITGNREVLGILSIIYNHHQRTFSKELTAIQHQHHHLVLTALHIHLDHHNCLEVILIRGIGNDVKNLANQIISLKGVLHGSLNLTSTGKNLE
ncbi:MAG: nickel-responsive transcriptional regulator NikR [Calditrichia bacterium]